MYLFRDYLFFKSEVQFMTDFKEINGSDNLHFVGWHSFVNYTICEVKPDTFFDLEYFGVHVRTHPTILRYATTTVSSPHSISFIKMLQASLRFGSSL